MAITTTVSCICDKCATTIAVTEYDAQPWSDPVIQPPRGRE